MTTADNTGADTHTPQEPGAHPAGISKSARIPMGPAHALILAGGDGVRLRPVTRAHAGDDRPKQFCALMGPESLLTQTRRRAELLVQPDQTVVVLTRRHEPYYRDLASELSPWSLVVQPEKRGTATAVLYGLLRIAARTPKAPVVILPSDHWVSNDLAFMAHVAAAVGVVEAHEDVVVLLGIPPDRAEPEYGWIEPSAPLFDRWRDLYGVRRFVEKPAPEAAHELLAARTFWNSSVIVGQTEALLCLLALAVPTIVESFIHVWSALGSPAEESSVERLYRELAPADFSRDVLARQPGSLAVLATSGFAWEDLGLPDRVLAACRRAAESRVGSSPIQRLRRAAL